MTLANRDASQITKKNRQKVIYGWKVANDTFVNVGGSVLREQSSFQSNEVVIERRQGGCKCTLDNSSDPYGFSGLTQCGCGAGNF